MNRQLKKRAGVLISALFLFSSLSFSQIENFDFLRSAPSDATKFLTAYMAPWTNAFGAGLNGGWYNTAKPHKLGGFDITTSFNVGVVPSSADNFNISTLGLTSVSTTGSGVTPTISGPDNNGPTLEYKDPTKTYTLASFPAPPGTAWRYIPVPTAQVGIGLPFGTEIKGRFVPKITIKDADISLWGVGLLHSLTQYLPGDKLLPFDVSLFGGYTKLQGNAPLSLLPESSIPQNYSPAVSFDNQKMNVVVTAINVSAIASLNLPVVTLYGGLGYSKSKSSVKLMGNYPTPVLVTSPTPHPEYNNTGVKTGANFPSMEVENFSGLRANIGLRIKLAVITIHADYTRAQYNVFSTGLGISFR
jgi:hypothetical protein